MTATEWQPSELQRERDAYRRARSRRSALIALVEHGVLVTVVVARRRLELRLGRTKRQLLRLQRRLAGPAGPAARALDQPADHADRRGVHPRLRGADRRGAHAARAGLAAGARARDGLRRRVPRAAAADRALPRRLRRSGAATCRVRRRARSCCASSRSSSPTPPTSPRCSAPASSRCTRRSGRRRARSG